MLTLLGARYLWQVTMHYVWRGWCTSHVVLQVESHIDWPRHQRRYGIGRTNNIY